MPKPPEDPIKASKRQHDRDRQERAHMVRLSVEQQGKADRLRGTRSVAGLLRDLLDEVPDKSFVKVAGEKVIRSPKARK